MDKSNSINIVSPIQIIYEAGWGNFSRLTDDAYSLRNI